jgi:exopolysaccharide biosynthesis predicted pyruvyltransferase EpsI
MTETANIFSAGLFTTNDPFVGFLNARAHKLFYLRPYLGNSGDELIFWGANQLLTDLGIKTTIDPRLADVVLWPGGNPTMWETNIEGWREIWQQFPNVEFVVAPATFQMGYFDWPSILNNEGKKLTGLFARDAESYQNLKKAGLHASVSIGLSHDPALCLRDTEWMASHRAAATNEYVLLAFRSDHEVVDSKGKSANLTINYLPKWIARRISWRLSRNARARKIEKITRTLPPASKVVDWDVSLANFHVYVEGVQRASIVHTDRLHVMLLAAMLQKPIVAYQTTYGKLEAVFENSLKEWAQVSFQR